MFERRRKEKPEQYLLTLLLPDTMKQEKEIQISCTLPLHEAARIPQLGEMISILPANIQLPRQLREYLTPHGHLELRVVDVHHQLITHPLIKKQPEEIVDYHSELNLIRVYARPILPRYLEKTGLLIRGFSPE